ncbi:FAD-dependent oxidoreductase [Nocardia arthritidis]|uniref:FAD-binding domain-containing protein n=1 Tax=Nocardia arthritidis TaxID=228602 RepID=A0A6G9YKU0_9NOCA|nr:FAD-dependent monooxygenase [Nocardia arthritidis]QIS13879.1 hypothetical protein F5544_30170 [Nocardia arthritidis]
MTFPAIANGGTVQFTKGRFATNAFFPLGRHRLAIALGFDHPTRARLFDEHGLAPDTPWTAIPAATKYALARTLAENTPIHGGLLTRSLELIDDWDNPRIYLWPMRDSNPLPHPYVEDRNLVLLGDSCHAFLPTIGMGASLAIEDAERLGSRLGAYLRRAHPTPGHLAAAVFEPWAKQRRPVWNHLMGRARVAAARNWVAQHENPRFEAVPYVPFSPYIPARIGSAVFDAAGKLRHRLRRVQPRPR